MKSLARVCLLFVLISCGAGSVRAQDVQVLPPDVKPAEVKAWEVVTSTEGRFAVSFPARPTAFVESVETTIGTLTFHEWVLNAAPLYRFTYVDYPQSIEDPNRVKQVLDAARDGGVRNVKGTLLEEKEISLDGHPGRYVKVRAGNGLIIRSQNYAVGNRGYTLVFATRVDGSSAAALRFYDESAAKFFDSFKLLPAEGSAQDKPLLGDPKWLPEAPPEGEVDRLLNDKSLGIVTATAGGADSEPQPASAPPPSLEGRVLNGSAIAKPAAVYPSLAKAARVQGTVAVKVIVDEEGRVMAAQVDSGHPLLHASALKAAREARFSPTLLDGKPVKVYGLITYDFVLQ
jgi:TonB family protein